MRRPRRGGQRRRCASRSATTSGDSDVTVRFVAVADTCTAEAIAPALAPGSVFAVCVIRRVELPAVPSVLEGRGITTIGRYTVHVDEFRDTSG